VVELRVVEPVEQVDRARTGRRGADPEAIAELGVPDGLERRHLLVPRLHEPRPVVGPPPRGQQPVDAVAREAEHVHDTPLPEPGEHVVADRLRSHDPSSSTSPSSRTPLSLRLRNNRRDFLHVLDLTGRASRRWRRR